MRCHAVTGFWLVLAVLTGMPGVSRGAPIYDMTIDTPTATPIMPPYTNTIGVLLGREDLGGGDRGPFTPPGGREAVREVTFTFPLGPVPFTDGKLYVTAAGDLGYREDEARLDFINAFAGPATDISAPLISSNLFKNFLTGVPAGESEGLDEDGVARGVNFHNVTGPTVSGGNARFSNGVNIFGNDVIVIPQAVLADLIAAGDLSFTLFPNPGETGNQGVARVKYGSVQLIYNTPEPSTAALVVMGCLALLPLGRRKRK